MNAHRLLAGTALLLGTSFAASLPPALHAQNPVTPQRTSQAPRLAIVSLYRVAPGKHLDFLRWMAQRDAVTTQAGLAPAQWYVHEHGDRWDYVAISPATTEAQDQTIAALAQQRGLPAGLPAGLTAGFAAALEFRQFINSHTDTYARGPLSAAEVIALSTRRQ